MREREIVEAVIEYYEGKLATFGATARGVDWKDEASQTKRFEQLVRALGLDDHHGAFSLVDFGCGYGALLPFLRQRHQFRYIGYDRSPQMIAEARRLHEDADEATFTSDWSAVASADFIVASGIFNVRLGWSAEEWSAYVLQTLTAINERAAAGWAANFLTGYSDEDHKRSDLYYAGPAAIFDWCKHSASRWVSLFHDYDLYEFTIGVRRRPC
jgi:SAM-dependent methyltransferase